MRKTEKFLAPIYGLKNSLERDIGLDEGVLLRNIKLPRENALFEEYGLKGHYRAVLEIDYTYNPTDPSEPLPGLYLNLVNKLDASLVVFGDGRVGVAAVIPSPDDDKFSGGGINFAGKIPLDECLDKKLDENFRSYYINFIKAYDMRAVAFDIFRRSQERFSNNDKAIDNCIVLESIFVPLGEYKKKPFILNGMKVMGFTAKEVETIGDLIEYRNAIIHADRKKQLKLLSGAKYTHKWFEETLLLVRQVLYKFVERPW